MTIARPTDCCCVAASRARAGQQRLFYALEERGVPGLKAIAVQSARLCLNLSGRAQEPVRLGQWQESAMAAKLLYAPARAPTS